VEFLSLKYNYVIPLLIHITWIHLLKCAQSLLVPLACLIHVLCDIFLLKLAHALDLIEIDDEACVVRVMNPDALAAEYSEVIGAIEVLDSLWVLLAQLLSEGILVLLSPGPAGLLEVEVGLRENRVLLDDLIEDVDVEGEAFRTLELLNELAADGASHTVVVVQVLDARGAQGVPAVHQDTGYTLSHVVAQPAELADVQAAG